MENRYNRRKVSTKLERITSRYIWSNGKKKQLLCRPKHIPVFNVTCSDSKKVTWREVLDLGRDLNVQYPFEAGVWYPGGDMTTNKLVHTLKLFFFQWVPAYIIDFLMFCFGQPRLWVALAHHATSIRYVIHDWNTRFKFQHASRAKTYLWWFGCSAVFYHTPMGFPYRKILCSLQRT